MKLEGFSDGLLNTLFAILVILLVALTGARGALVGVIYVMVGGAIALQWAHAGMLYALADLAHRGGADAGVLALFTLGYTMDDSDRVRSGRPGRLHACRLRAESPSYVRTFGHLRLAV